ncbi:hypothetical protein FAF44_18565 [Nonomuraea sp. MG754425]|uniref:DUF5722 domain-containing protein n=1 Tax=Nonomuraea sp. MG754425 TaxID=2570319 RepID=UPI001F362CCB|nr:DUF5722 domain-containing protein [Nonomuraea sp. MG754425]MCF6470385.1 hypothetical protein [Nonomuraea sp. MG754425]
MRMRLLTALALAVPLAMPLYVSAPAYAATGGVSGVEVGESTITLTGTAPAAAELYALDTWQDSHTGEQPVATVEAGEFRVEVPRMDGDQDRLYDKFLAVGADGPLGEVHYADKLSFASASQTPYPEMSGKKGLQVQMTDDAEEIGVQHAGINLALDSVMTAGPGAPDNTIEFVSQGRTFYFDRGAVAGLDAQVKPLSDNGVLVNLIVLVYNSTAPNSAARTLIHPEAELGKGTVYAFNTKTAEGEAHFTAAMEFFAQRYSQADGRYGRAWGWIVGNEIDAQQFWYNMGPQDRDVFLEQYTRAMRLTWQSVRKADAAARVYTSLTHFWTGAANADSRYTYKGRDVVDGLNALTKRQGDFDWHIAYHPYPENLFNPAFWNDKTATDDFDTMRITFKNIELLPRYLAQEHLTYGGERRRVILSEQGLNSQDYSAKELELQAAAYAYAYYKVAFADGIDSFILHRHVDHKQEGGLRLGLWTWDEEHSAASNAGERKPLHEVFDAIDTGRSQEVTEFAKKVIGISDWKDVIPGFDPAALAVRKPPAVVGTQLDARPVAEKVISGFESDTGGWRPSDNAAAVERVAVEGGHALRVRFDRDLPGWSQYAKSYKGADVLFDKALDASRTPRLSVSIRVPESADDTFKPGNVFTAKVRAYGRDGAVAEGVGAIDPALGWNRLTLDLSRWAPRSAISRVKVWVRGSVGSDWAGSYEIDRLSLAAVTLPSLERRNVEVSAATAERGRIGSTVTFTVTNRDVLPMAGNVKLTACDGVSVDPAALRTAGLASGAARSFDTALTAFAPANQEYPVVCAAHQGQEHRVTFRLAPEAGYVPPAPDAFANLELNDGFDQAGDYQTHRVQPENQELPQVNLAGGALSASHPSAGWFGMLSSGVAPRNPAFSTAITVKKFQGDSADMDTVYTGLVKDGKTDVAAFYVNTQKFAGFEVRGPQVPGGLAVFGVKQGVSIPDGGRFALSMVGDRAAMYADTGSGWELVTAATLEHLPELSDPEVRAGYRYGFGVRGDAGPNPLVLDAVQGRSIS